MLSSELPGRVTVPPGARRGGQLPAQWSRAFRWFAVRATLAGLALSAIVGAAVWFGVFPGAFEARLSAAWGSVPAPIRLSVPEERIRALREGWARRAHGQAGAGLGRALLPALPESWLASLDPESVRPSADPDSALPDGAVISALGRLRPDESLWAGEGSLLIRVELGPVPLSDGLRATVRPMQGDAAARDLVVGEALRLPAGLYELLLAWDPGAGMAEVGGGLRGVPLRAGQRTEYSLKLRTQVAFVQPAFLAGGREVNAAVTLDAWDATTQASGLAILDPPSLESLGPPAWTRSADRALLAVPSGRWRIRARLEEAGRAATIQEIPALRADPAADPVALRAELPEGEPSSPAGPGLRVLATNFGKDVNSASEVIVFSEESGNSTATAVARGPAGRYLPVPAGTWEIQLAYAPSALAPQLRGVRSIRGVEIPEGRVFRASYDVELPLAWVDAAVLEGSEDASARLRVRAVRPGADPDSATTVLDQEGRGPHPLPPGTWDLKVDWTGQDGSPREALFREVALKNGQVWRQRWDAAATGWSAAAPRPRLD